MRVLPNVDPTPEQLPLVTDYKPGTMVITGAAGSGKTSTALLRLRFLKGFWLRRLRDGHVDAPIRILVLTYNKTLKAYVAELARQQIGTDDQIDLQITTFGKWSWYLLDRPELVGTRFDRVIRQMGSILPRDSDFVLEEADYVLGRFLPDRLGDYITAERRGRGVAPRMDQHMKRRLLAEVIDPYNTWKAQTGLSDWNDLAVILAQSKRTDPFHVVIVDEAQDFSANQVRAIVNHLEPEHSLTFVIDSAQRIYPRIFSWTDVGLDVRLSRRLTTNYRNTARIAAFATPLIAGINLPSDASLPNFQECQREGGELPVLIRGTYTAQMDYVIQRIQSAESGQSHAILQARGGGWFDEAHRRLQSARIDYVDLTRRSEWPTGAEQVALSTMHSAKGLEFDHVYIVGLNAEVTPHGADPDDTLLENYRRLLAMAIGRAKYSVTIGYKPEEASTLVRYLDPSTFRYGP